MKKLMAILLIVVMVFAMTACNTNVQEAQAENTNAEQNKAEQAEPVAEPSKEEWKPTQDIECIVPFAPGGGSDLLTRKIIEYVDIGVNLVAVNIEGGAGLVGAEQAAREEADGYTILAHNPMNLISQGLTGTSDVWQRLEPLAFVVDDWTVLYTSKDTGWTSMDDFVNYAKEHPTEVKWGFTSAPVTTADSYRIQEKLGVECTMVPYDGGAEGNVALMGNHIQILMNTASDASVYVDSGDYIPLAVLGTVRCPSLPDIPTLKELGIDVDTSAPRAYFAPAGCSEEVIDYYDNLFKNLCENQDFIDDCAAMGFTVSYTGAKEGKELMQSWYNALLPVFQEYGLAG